MLTEYIRAAMKKAVYEILPDDKTFYGEIPGFQGIWANADTLEVCREELQEVLEDWILFSVWRNLPLPIVEGMELTVREAVSCLPSGRAQRGYTLPSCFILRYLFTTATERSFGAASRVSTPLAESIPSALSRSSRKARATV